MPERIALCGGKTNRTIRSRLLSMGYRPVLLPSYKRLPEPVSSHPDMLIYRLSSGALLTYTEYYNENRALFNMIECEVITEERLPGNRYPEDIYLNALRIGDTVIGRTDKLSRHILRDAENAIYVRQGYARCSACVVDRDIITADTRIASAASGLGGRVTLTESGNIALEGYDYGFIGGASCRLKEGIAFFGDIMTHPSGENIKAAVLSRGFDVIKLDDGILTDLGGLIVI
ncbi:MAG: hypothetical protein PHZ09_01125 [Eubacteriales bacterium]|nr:hypothetical protein [Eubacteriales bacterium]